MTRVDDYGRELKGLKDWRSYLMERSGLPGPRGNLELAQAAAELADEEQVEKLLATPPDQAPENSPGVFLVFCGITALGKLAARGRRGMLPRLRGYASDTRWRVREAVVIALQYIGDEDMPRLLREMEKWARGDNYEKRAAAAALAEPRLLRDAATASEVLALFDEIMRGISAEKQRDESFRVLRQSMGYCLSVAAAAAPKPGQRLLEKWMRSPDPEIRWIIKENLKKNRLVKMDAAWVTRCKAALEGNK